MRSMWKDHAAMDRDRGNASREVTPATRPGTIAAAICTRNRGASLVPTLETLLANDLRDFTLIIVDQSTTDVTAAAVAPFLNADGPGEPHVHYLRTDTIG